MEKFKMHNTVDVPTHTRIAAKNRDASLMVFALLPPTQHGFDFQNRVACFLVAFGNRDRAICRVAKHTAPKTTRIARDVFGQRLDVPAPLHR
jgi:hypothetical protein